MVTAATWKSGFMNGLRTTGVLLRVVIPVFGFVKVLEHTPLIGWISKTCDPLMGLLGLPGEAALAMVTGMVFNFYAAVGITVALGLTPWQMTILAVILSCCHELILETAIIRRTGIRAWPIVGIRLATALSAGAGMNLFAKLLR